MKTILYVEDNEDNVYMLENRLRRRGYDVRIARDGKEGVARAGSDRPDLVIIDLVMPVMDGWEAAGLLKSDPATRDIPIIALSANAMAGEREKALAAGCNEYDTKPVDFGRLLEKIESLVG